MKYDPYDIKGIFLPKFLLKFIRKITRVKYVNLNSNVYGSSNTFGIKINKRISTFDQEQSLEHEYVHIYQRWQSLFLIHILLKLVSKKYKIYVEASAFAVSVKVGLSLEVAANSLAKAKSYADIGLTPEKAEKEIRKYL